MEFGITIFDRLDRVALLGVEMVLSGLARQKLARFGELEALGIRLIGFHAHIEPYILLISVWMSSSPADREV